MSLCKICSALDRFYFLFLDAFDVVDVFILFLDVFDGYELDQMWGCGVYSAMNTKVGGTEMQLFMLR